MIGTVVTGELGLVEVVDENGKRMPEYCGPYDKVKKRILRDAPKEAEFFNDTNRKAIPRENW